MTRDELEKLYNVMQEARARVNLLVDGSNTFDGRLKYDTTYDEFWEAKKAYEAASLEYRARMA